MKKIFTYFLSVIFFLNQISATANAVTIEKKLKIHQLSNCINIYKDNFNEYIDCLNNEVFSSNKFAKLSTKSKRDIKSLLSIANILGENIEDKFLKEEQVISIWKDILDTKYKKKIKKKKLSQILDDSKCINKNDYNIFIRCFASEFRNLGVYKSSNLLTKRRIETIMINSLYLTQEDSEVYASAKDSLIGGITYENSDGFDFFFTLMNGLGNDYFKEKEKEINWKKVITFIIIALIIAYFAKSLLKKGSSGSSQGSASSGTTSTAGATNPVNSATGYYNQIPVKYATNYKITYYKPYIDVTQKTWFKYAMKSRFGF